MKEHIKILIVEDEIIISMLLREQLADSGYAISDAVTIAADAIISAKRNPPDMILMDINLEGEIDGIESAAVIKSESDIPVLFMTGYDDPSIRERAEKLKPIGYLIKPISIDEIKSVIDSYFHL